jgi:sulfopyruvate decarboxylase subunit beta
MTGASRRMNALDALAVLHERRRPDEVVLTTMGTARDWMALGTGPLDLVFVPSAMGHATSFGLGLALARPDRQVVVCNGDGSMLMNLGSLVSITAAAPPNLHVVVFDNGVYEVTGAQPTPGAATVRADFAGVDFTAVARACGFAEVHRFDELAAWSRQAREVLDAPGPGLITLAVAARPGAPGPRSPGPAPERARRFMDALGALPSDGRRR